MHAGNVDQIRKELTFGYALGKEVRDKLQQSSKRQKEKALIHKVITGPILAKYRLLNKAKQDLLLSKNQLNRVNRSGKSGSLLQH